MGRIASKDASDLHEIMALFKGVRELDKRLDSITDKVQFLCRVRFHFEKVFLDDCPNFESFIIVQQFQDDYEKKKKNGETRSMLDMLVEEIDQAYEDLNKVSSEYENSNEIFVQKSLDYIQTIEKVHELAQALYQKPEDQSTFIEHSLHLKSMDEMKKVFEEVE